jgi:hypothetical protein
VPEPEIPDSHIAVACTAVTAAFSTNFRPSSGRFRLSLGECPLQEDIVTAIDFFDAGHVEGSSAVLRKVVSWYDSKGISSPG